ncbi:hypothetical protein QQF64_034278 [Cirrhinus molitorella]|uniref:Ig-like domain-containing protein n=1 Tax=Cirrhinus molitorella TaxID=172907 RepID=A0ABR3L2Z3_9TELE
MDVFICMFFTSLHHPHRLRSVQAALCLSPAGDKLKISDSRYQISAPGHCIITLTTTLLNEDDNREWRCEVTQGDQVKTSVTYTVKISAPVDSETQIPVSRSNSETTSRQTTAAAPEQDSSSLSQVIVIMIAVGASFAVFLLALIVWLILKKRAGVRRAADESVEQTDRADVTYTEVTVNKKKQAKKNKVRCDDQVTYASIRGAEAGAQEDCSQIYATVNKSHHKSGK